LKKGNETEYELQVPQIANCSSIFPIFPALSPPLVKCL